MLELLKSGEPFIWANVLVSLLSLVLIVQRVHTLWIRLRIATGEGLLKQVIGFVESGSYARAIQVCTAMKHPLATIFAAALGRANRSEREIRRAVEVTAIAELPRLKKGTLYMPQLSNVATLLGLIGTIRGLIISFSGVAEKGDAAARQSMLSQGISIAFNNTFFGLTVAVSIIVAYMVILSRQNKVLEQMELGSAQLIDHLLIQHSSDRTRGAA